MRRAAVLLGVVLTATTVVGAAAARSAAPACRTSDLVVWLDTTENAGAGSRFLTLELTNQSGHACTVTGYPGVSALDLRGRGLGSPAARDPSKLRIVRLANGATARAALRIAVAANFPASVCHPRAAAGFRVYPPDETVAKVVAFPFAACSRPGPVFLSVKAFAA